MQVAHWNPVLLAMCRPLSDQAPVVQRDQHDLALHFWEELRSVAQVHELNQNHRLHLCPHSVGLLEALLGGNQGSLQGQPRAFDRGQDLTCDIVNGSMDHDPARLPAIMLVDFLTSECHCELASYVMGISP